MARVAEGDIVRIYCAGRLTDGREFELAPDGGTLEFIVGHGDLLPALEKAIIGMTPGESKTVVVPRDKAYGPRREELVEAIPRKDLPEGITPRIGQRLRLPAEDYEVVNATIVQITDTEIIVDGNHPLAGQDVLFHITLEEIVTL
jgi:peptidylprolyl isomerase